MQDLTRRDYKPDSADKSVGTDVSVGPNEVNPKPPKKPKTSRRHHRHVGTQTMEEDHACLLPMPATSLAPYLKLRDPSPILSDYESDGETANSDKMEWMFQSPNSSARCLAIRPQVRLLRVLKRNLAKHNPVCYSKYKDILPDAVGWDLLGPELQNLFTMIYKLGHILEMLPLEPILMDSRQSVVRCLTHLLSHLPIPNCVAQTFNMVEINQPRTNAMSAYLYGWKVKEVINLLRSAYHSERSSILPDYFKAELCRTDRVSYNSLKFALQGIRNATIPHNLYSDFDPTVETDFVAASETEAVLPMPGPSGLVDWYGLENDSSSIDSDSSGSDVEISLQPRRTAKKKCAAGASPRQGRSNVATPVDINPSHGVAGKKLEGATFQAAAGDHVKALANKERRHAKSQTANSSLASDILQNLSVPQLVAMSKVVQSRIKKIQSGSSELPQATSKPSLPSSSFHIDVLSQGIAKGKVLCNPISSYTPLPAAKDKVKAATSDSQHLNVTDVAQSRVRVQPLVQPLSEAKSSSSDVAKFQSMKQSWKLPAGTGLSVWQPVTATTIASSLASDVPSASQGTKGNSQGVVWPGYVHYRVRNKKLQEHIPGAKQITTTRAKEPTSPDNSTDQGNVVAASSAGTGDQSTQTVPGKSVVPAVPNSSSNNSRAPTSLPTNLVCGESIEQVG